MVNLLSFASVMKSVGGVLLAVLILLAMVTVHEFGHYLAGKLLNFKINEFSVGFGPALFKKRSKKTGELFALRLIPLGGYCAFDGEDEESADEKKTNAPFAEMEANEGGTVALNEEAAPVKEEEAPQTNDYPEPKGERFNDQKPWKRIIVLLAGATMNYLFALCLIIVMFACFGRPLYQVAAPTENTPEMSYSALQAGDVITEIDGKDVYLITDYMDALDGKKRGDTVIVTVLRDGAEQQQKITLLYDASFANMTDTNPLLYSMGVAGLAPATAREGFFETIGHSAGYSVRVGGMVLRSLGELLTGKIGITSMGGPVTTIKVTSQAAASGWLSFLNIAAFIGVNLAVFNLLPIPALDGCKVIFCIIEWIRRKPVNRKVEAIIHFGGIIFLFGFAILVDLLQLF